jgi:hypothetical protein
MRAFLIIIIALSNLNKGGRRETKTNETILRLAPCGFIGIAQRRVDMREPPR